MYVCIYLNWTNVLKVSRKVKVGFSSVFLKQTKYLARLDAIKSVVKWQRGE